MSGLGRVWASKRSPFTTLQSIKAVHIYRFILSLAISRIFLDSLVAGFCNILASVFTLQCMKSMPVKILSIQWNLC